MLAGMYAILTHNPRPMMSDWLFSELALFHTHFILALYLDSKRVADTGMFHLPFSSYLDSTLKTLPHFLNGHSSIRLTNRLLLLVY